MLNTGPLKYHGNDNFLSVCWATVIRAEEEKQGNTHGVLAVFSAQNQRPILARR